MYRLRGVNGKYCMVISFFGGLFGFWRLICLGICELSIATLETQGHIKTDHGLEKRINLCIYY
jgi:hypothetical protein